MNTHTEHPEDVELRAHLREARPQPGLPPRFQENVWRRIEQAELHGRSSNWIEALAALILKPRFAVTTICTVVILGALVGSWSGSAQARQVAQERYVAAVIMPVAP